jgi:hypothetical protein
MKTRIEGSPNTLLADGITLSRNPLDVAVTLDADDGVEGRFEAMLRFEVNARGRGRCTRLELRPAGDAAVTSSVLRKLPIDRIGADEIRRLAAYFGPARETAPGVIRADLGSPPAQNSVLEELVTHRREPRRGLPVTNQHLRDVAAVYSAALKDDPIPGDRGQRAPLQAVETEWDVSRSTASKWVARAREIGALPRTQRGKATA